MTKRSTAGAIPKTSELKAKDIPRCAVIGTPSSYIYTGTFSQIYSLPALHTIWGSISSLKYMWVGWQRHGADRWFPPQLYFIVCLLTVTARVPNHTLCKSILRTRNKGTQNEYKDIKIKLT